MFGWLGKSFFEFVAESYNADLGCLWLNLADKNYLPIAGQDLLSGAEGDAAGNAVMTRKLW